MSTLHALTIAISGGILLAALAEIVWRLWRNRQAIKAALTGQHQEDDTW